MEHEALLYSSQDDAATALAGWVTDGLREGARVVLAVPRDVAELVIDRLGPRAGSATFIPRSEVYRSPAGASDRLRQQLEGAGDAPVWSAGEIPWECRVPAWRRAWARYEAVLNEVFRDASGRLLCLYDQRRLSDQICGHAHATHPSVAGESGPNERYLEPSEYCARLAEEAAEPAANRTFELHADRDLSQFRAALSARLPAIGLAGRMAADTVLAVHELVANAIEHGGGDATVRGWREPGAAVIEVEDEGPGGVEALAGEGSPGIGDARGRGVYLARRLAHVLEYPAHPSGCLARLYQVTSA